MSELVPKLKNTHLEAMETDFLYHLNIAIDQKDTSDIERHFGDVKFVCMGGTASRMLAMAQYINKEIFQKAGAEEPLIDLAEGGHRYALYKVGPVLCCSHGVGMSTMSVVLHELLKLVRHAKCRDPIFIRVGTCGGLGLEPGTVVVTAKAYNGLLRNEYELAILGERVARKAIFNEAVVQGLAKCGGAPGDDFRTLVANTMGTDCFYEGQARLDGASCEYTDAQKMAFLQRCHDDFGIRNIEMEAPMFAALTGHVGVKAADVCVTLLNRLLGDQIALAPGAKERFEKRPLEIVGRYIKHVLNL